MKNVLLISPTWVNLHIDIQKGLTMLGYHVDFLPQYSFKRDPLRVSCRHPMNVVKAEKNKSQYWQNQLQNTTNVYDYLLVIDGQGINSTLFDILKKRNSDIYCVCYLYDTTYALYNFSENFHHFNKIFTFDKTDSEKYHIEHLPIYWLLEPNAEDEPATEVFGFGAYSYSRFIFYSQIKHIANELKLTHFIKVYHAKIKNLIRYSIYLWVRNIFGMKRLMSVPEYSSDLTTNELVTTQRYRKMIIQTKTVLDTKVLNQDGLTARFMWALGAGKKIITTNESIKDYEFYSEEQILLVKDGILDFDTENRIKRFLLTPFTATETITKKIEQYRLDKWLKRLFEK